MSGAMGETEREVWARLVRVLSQMVTGADVINETDEDERKAALGALRDVGVDVDRYLNPPLRVPEPTPEEQWEVEEAAIRREFRVVSMADLLSDGPRTMAAFRRARLIFEAERGGAPRAVIATGADVKALVDDMARLRLDVVSRERSPMPINRHRYIGTIAGVPIYIPEQT